MFENLPLRIKTRIMLFCFFLKNYICFEMMLGLNNLNYLVCFSSKTSDLKAAFIIDDNE